MDSDTSNPHTFNTGGEPIATELVNLDEDDRWISLVNLCDSHRDSVVVVSSGARNSKGPNPTPSTTSGDEGTLNARHRPASLGQLSSLDRRRC